MKALLLPAVLLIATFAHAQVPGTLISLPFDGSTAASGFGNSAQKTIGSITFEKGVIGQAATFDGSSWIEFSDTPSLRPAQWTVAAWAAPQQNQCGGRILEKGASNSFWLLFSRGRATVGFLSPQAGYQEIASSTDFKANEWHFVVGVFDGTSLRLYVDGALESLSKTLGSPRFTSQPLVVGAKFQGVAGDCFIGALDDVTLFNKPLSENEILALYAKGR